MTGHGRGERRDARAPAQSQADVGRVRERSGYFQRRQRSRELFAVRLFLLLLDDQIETQAVRKGGGVRRR